MMSDVYHRARSLVSGTDHPRDRSAALLERKATLGSTCVLAILAAAASVALSGFQFGIINNIFHLPIVAALYNDPQFRNDVFIQSLRYYASGVWLLLSGSGHYVSPYWLFLALDYLSRLLSFAGFLCCASLLGVETLGERLVFVIILCFSSVLRGYSYPGNGGLFINYFTHSEIANGTALLSIFFASRGRFTAALALTGATFFTNAFMAAWLLPPLGFIAIWKLKQREISPSSLVWRATIGAALALIIALPVVYNVLHNPDLANAQDINFREYLLEYYPDHIFFWAASLRHKISLAVVVLYGFLCLFLLGRVAAHIAVALLGSAVVFAIGIGLPLLTGRLMILDLHLIRSSSNIFLLAGLASAALTTKWLCSRAWNDSKCLGPLLLLADCTWRFIVPLGLATMAVAWWMQRRGRQPRLPRLDYVAGALLLFFIWPKLTWQDVATNEAIGVQTREWQTLGEWARATTSIDTIFLVPTWYLPGETTPAVPPGEAYITSLGNGSEVFEFTSHRRVWVDFRRGGAVLWAPSYYAIWWKRISEVMVLHSVAEKLSYAHRHGISYVIAACVQDGKHAFKVAFRLDDLCVYPAAPSAEIEGRD